MSDQIKYLLDESRLPKAWYNIAADLPVPLPPPLHPGTLQPLGPADLAPLFPNAIIAQVYGVRYLGMLGGIVFFSHQIGSFLGAWLGGKLYDATGNYNTVWMLTIALGVFAARARAYAGATG